MISKRPEELAQLRPNERAALADFLDRLRARFAGRIRQVILYGSRARGEGDEESDVDVLVVADRDEGGFRRAIVSEAADAWLTHGPVLSPLVMGQTRFDQQARWRLLFYRELEKDGIELWTTPRNEPIAATALSARATTSG